MNDSTDAIASMTLDELLELDRTATDAEVINFASRWYRSPGRREQAIREQFGVTPTRFFQFVNNILESPTRIGQLPADLGPVVKRLVDERERQLERRRPLRAV